MTRALAFLAAVVVLFIMAVGCASAPTVIKPTSGDQAIIDAGIRKAKDLGLRPFPLIGEGKAGKVTIISPAVVTYDRQGKWVITNQDLYINATRGDIVLEGLTIRRGQYAREVDSKLIIVKESEFEYDQKIVDGGRNRAESLKLNPVPVFMKKDGTISIVRGTLFTIKNNQWVIKDGDMIINAGNTAIKIQGLSLNRGEYAVIKNSIAEKGADNLISE